MSHLKAVETATARRPVPVVALESLTRFVAECREQEKDHETIKATASKDCEQAIQAATAERDRVHAIANAELKNIRFTLETLEPARAKMAEQAAG